MKGLVRVEAGLLVKAAQRLRNAAVARVRAFRGSRYPEAANDRQTGAQSPTQAWSWYDERETAQTCLVSVLLGDKEGREIVRHIAEVDE